MTTVVITGAAGYVGRTLAAHLAGSELTVIPVSRRSFPDTIQVQDYSQSPAGDILIHLAEEPDRNEVNRQGEAYIYYAASVIKALSSRFNQRIIYASSGAVYGDKNESPCKTDMPVVATDTYSKSKLHNEKIILDSGGTVVRLSNLFGNGMSTKNVLSDIIRQISEPGPLWIRDDKPVRDYLPVSETATVFGLLIEHNCCGIVNVGSGIGTSVRTLAEFLLSFAEQEDREIRAMDPSSELSINVLDISETTKTIGWSPASSLKDQLDQFICNKAKLIYG